MVPEASRSLPHRSAIASISACRLLPRPEASTEIWRTRNVESATFRGVEAHLTARGPYLLGERFSSADYQLCMYMRWSRAMPKPATKWPELDRLARLVSARPAWRNAVAMEGLRGWHLDSAEPVQ